MSDIAPAYLPCCARIGHLSTHPNRSERQAMSTYQDLTAMTIRSAGAASRGTVRAKAIALETVQTLSGTVRDALFAYAMTGSAVASLAIIAAPHFEVLLRCVFHGRG
jgi:hypothetical protein